MSLFLNNIFDTCTNYAINILRYLEVSFECSSTNKVDQLCILLYAGTFRKSVLSLSLASCFEYTTQIFVRFFADLPDIEIANIYQLEVVLHEISKALM